MWVVIFVATTSEDNGAGITFTVPESSANDVLTENIAIDDQDDLCQDNNDQLAMPSLDISHEVGDQLQVSTIFEPHERPLSLSMLYSMV